MNTSLHRRNPHLTDEPWKHTRLLVLGFLGTVFALSCLAEPGAAKFHSGSHHAPLAFRAPMPKSVERRLAAEHSKIIDCNCRVVTADDRPVFKESQTTRISLGACEAKDGKTFLRAGKAPAFWDCRPANN